MLNYRRKIQKKLETTPFLSDELLGDEPLSCSAAAFDAPKLGRCPFDLNCIDWKRSRRLGGGLDGYAWKIRLDGRPYALKMLWDTEPMTRGFDYYAPLRECRNNALLQLMDAAVREGPPILINPNPKTKKDALNNTWRFSREGRESDFSADYEPMVISSMPRMRQCYGWGKINSEMIRKDKWPLSSRIDRLWRFMERDKEYIAIIYEYIDEKENDPAVVKQVSDFLWRVGFGHNGCSLASNWKDNVLVDLSDIIHANGYGWNERLYGPREASEILRS